LRSRTKVGRGPVDNVKGEKGGVTCAIDHRGAGETFLLGGRDRKGGGALITGARMASTTSRLELGLRKQGRGLADQEKERKGRSRLNEKGEDGRKKNKRRKTLAKLCAKRPCMHRDPDIGGRCKYDHPATFTRAEVTRPYEKRGGGLE